ncbi:hypothetical protein ACFX1Z_037465 [Malus domestica]
MLVQELIDKERRMLCDTKLSAYFEEKDMEHIRALPISNSLPPDKLVWHYTDRGQFTVKNAYEVAWDYVKPSSLSASSSALGGNPFTPLWKAIWQAGVPSKDCSFARATWFATPCSLLVDSVPCGSVKEWFMLLLQNHHLDFNFMCVMVWHLWQERNYRIWKGNHGSLAMVAQRAVSWLQKFQVAVELVTAAQHCRPRDGLTGDGEGVAEDWLSYNLNIMGLVDQNTFGPRSPKPT